jgi:hypothetical protein
MDSTDHAPAGADALALLSRLTLAEIEARIATLRAEDAALRTLLRALRARERRAKATHNGKGVADG